jgi:FkbM family methyltransferase
MPDEKAPSSGAFLPASLMYFCSGVPMHFLSGVDRSILDVGVSEDTPSLRVAFPGLQHYLFEPVAAHFPTIKKNYAAVRHILHPVAVSNEDGEAFLNTFSITNDTGKITHSSVSDRAEDASDPTLVGSVRIEKRKLDTLTRGLIDAPFLLKVDVDGHDLQVLQGAEQTLQKCAAVMIEAPLWQIAERLKYLTDRGFQLFDIVDLSYYKGAMWQVDLMFLSVTVMDTNERLRPLRSGVQLDPAQWHTAG